VLVRDGMKKRKKKEGEDEDAEYGLRHVGGREDRKSEEGERAHKRGRKRDRKKTQLKGEGDERGSEE